MKIALLNINRNGVRVDDKWGAINNVTKVRRIAILAAQETHPSLEVQERLQRQFHNLLLFFHSADPDEPSGQNGVTIALNKGLVKLTGMSTTMLVEGRAIMISIPWNGEDTLQIMNVYAPVKNNEKATFWEELCQKM